MKVKKELIRLFNLANRLSESKAWERYRDIKIIFLDKIKREREKERQIFKSLIMQQKEGEFVVASWKKCKIHCNYLDSVFGKDFTLELINY